MDLNRLRLFFLHAEIRRGAEIRRERLLKNIQLLKSQSILKNSPKLCFPAYLGVRMILDREFGGVNRLRLFFLHAEIRREAELRRVFFIEQSELLTLSASVEVILSESRLPGESRRAKKNISAVHTITLSNKSIHSKYLIVRARRVKELFQDFPCYDNLLNLAGAFTDCTKFRITVKFLHRKIFGVAITSKNLHRFGSHSH